MSGDAHAPKRGACAACRANEMRPFHRIPGAPVQSNILIESRDDARQLPEAPIDLSVCERCGFIANVSFMPDLVDYSAPYEEAQNFSARFRTFADAFAVDLVRRYSLTHSDIVEIGCGKGDFLERLCELGGNRGVGIDPSYRARGDLEPRARYVTEFYEETHTELPADLIVCRHTLEHIRGVRPFAERVRRAALLSGAVVVFEVPDVERVLREHAFWDVYYEHCSYFDANSLAALLRASGFEVLSTELVFDRQYLVIEARATDRGSDPAPGSGATISRLADGFAAAQRDLAQEWGATLEDRKRRDQSVVVWGASSKAVGFLAQVPGASAVDRVVDINPHKQGRFVPGTGQQIIAPEDLAGAPPGLVIVMNPIYESEIRAQLEALGVVCDVVSL